jgi:uncharacterized protein (DUF1015 family)
MLRMDTTPPREPELVLHPFRALRLADSYVGAPVAHRAFARPYRSVPGRLREWRRRRHLRLDPAPAIYVHEYTSAGVAVRGVVALLDLDGAAGAIFPHEDVHTQQTEQLTQRMEDMALNPAPILLMHRGGVSVRELLEPVTALPPDLVYTDRGDQLHRIWRVTDRAAAARLADALRTARAVIADGHHRYAAARTLHARHPGTDWARTLVMLVDQDDTPLQLSAIHRTVPRLTLTAVEETARRRGDVFTRHASSHVALADLEHALVLHDGQHWATLRPGTRHHRMFVCWLHEDLLPAWQVEEERLVFHHSAGEALERAGTGLAVLLPAPTYDQVDASARSGVLLPQKATSFQPKPHLGVLMRAVPDE